MNLLITSALRLTEGQIHYLEREHTVYLVEQDGAMLDENLKRFSLDDVEGIVCNYFFQYNSVKVFKNLQFVQMTSVGMERVPVKYFIDHDIRFYSAGSVYSTPMAEWAVGKILDIYKNSRFFFQKQQQHVWIKNRDIPELAGSLAVIVGFGNVGRKIAERLQSFDVRVCAVDIVNNVKSKYDYYSVEELPVVAPKADILILTLPLTDATRGIIDMRILSGMKSDATIINVARGALIDELSLIDQLEKGRFRGVALDVFEEEPLPTDSPLWDMENVIVTPHNSFVGNRNSERLFNALVRNLKDCTQSK